MPAPCSCLSMASPALTPDSPTLGSGILSWAKALWEEDKLTHCSPSALTAAGHWLRLCAAPVPAVFKACECLWYALAAASPAPSQSPRHFLLHQAKALNFITLFKAAGQGCSELSSRIYRYHSLSTHTRMIFRHQKLNRTEGGQGYRIRAKRAV